LAGRTAVLELLPFTVEEIRRYKDHPQALFEWIHRGFYPGLHENALQPSRFYRSYTATYIERDLRTLIQLKDLALFETFLRLLAGRVGQLVNYASLANDVGVSATTIKTWISILKACYILFELPPWFANIDAPLKRRRNGTSGRFVNATNRVTSPKRSSQRALGSSEGGVNEVDLLATSAGRSFTAIEIKSAATFQPDFIKGIDVFCSSVGEDIPVQGRVWYNGDRKTTYRDVQVSNPLLHGLAVEGGRELTQT